MAQRALNKLTARQVTAFVKDGKPASRLGDGGGLYVVKRATGSVSWMFIASRDKKTLELGGGAIGDVTLADAREWAGGLRKRLANGATLAELKGTGDAFVQGVVTFKAAADEFRDAFKGTWKGDAKVAEWDRAVDVECKPILECDVAGLKVADVLKVLDAMGEGRPTVARHVLSVIRRVIDREIAKGTRSADSVNPAEWSRIKLVRPIKYVRTNHPSMSYERVPAFVKGLRAKNTVTARALELLILTGLRSSELLSAHWAWIDFEACTMTIPATFMKGGRKGGRSHVVPLVKRAIELLKLQQGVAPNLYVFPGQRENGHMVTSAFRTCLPDDATAHGFRSSLRQYLADRTETPHWVAEGVLAHVTGGVEGAYRREQSLLKHGEALKAWADFIG